MSGRAEATSASSAPLARQRRHTLHFLAEIRAMSPVFLDTEVDMSAVLAHREAGRQYSVVSYVLHTAARVLAHHPRANAAVRGRRVAGFDGVNGKLALDKRIGGERVVLAAVLPDLHEASLAEIQRQVEHFRDGDPDTMPEFAGVRALHKLGWPLGRLAFRRVVRPLRTRAAVLGTFSVTSLGHRAVDGFYSVGGTTTTFGVGRIVRRAVVRGDAIVIAPVLRLSLTFDHRVIDGAEAADVLTEVRHALESFVDSIVPIGQKVAAP
ncbi:MAG TPA: 2-oxo acid dehydrogenase subunit E2 [Actinophytocola sp.]|jgi:pyruvate/2-oxoglutarate dehydrogenase complex dihydrolipoamide acyltransferase (E2) component|uniref:2-oxo acid dehydrogenase subunit E2 n=1 Tax=Actinophytocola sp. TaxID=1872138 RepID=UPI002E088444|nr:2-oxo acid dehydrogenase subunit E2 [Actinophytocola sp.]